MQKPDEKIRKSYFLIEEKCMWQFGKMMNDVIIEKQNASMKFFQCMYKQKSKVTQSDHEKGKKYID